MELYGFAVIAVTKKPFSINLCGIYYMREDAEIRREEIIMENYYPKSIIEIQGTEIYFPPNL